MTTATAGALFAEARAALADISDGPLEAAMLTETILALTRAQILAYPETPVSADAQQLFRAALARRRNGEPLAYILGLREFYGRPFLVNPSVLIPRPESELLIEQLLVHAPDARRICEIGTGSGCLAITAALQMPAAAVCAGDISAEALVVARVNAERHAVDGRIRFSHGDMFHGIGGRFDAIIANLPYIPTADLIEVNTRRFEPQLALDGGPDGLDMYRRFAAAASAYAAAPCLMLLEAAPPTIPGLLALMRDAFPAARTDVVADYAGRARIVRCVAFAGGGAITQGESLSP